jgi:protein-S-isoprenylcysteine O-methyltransferase Ste14
MRLIVRSFFFTLALPGAGILLIPYTIIRASGPTRRPAFLPIQIVAVCFWTIFILTLLYCIWGFARYGAGTLAPIDPPKHLVISGFYRFTRNPMYLAVTGALLNEAIYFDSLAIFLYTVIAFGLFHLFVILYEEPKLKAIFGEEYDQYRASVPRWWITRTPYDRSTA